MDRARRGELSGELTQPTVADAIKTAGPFEGLAVGDMTQAAFVYEPAVLCRYALSYATAAKPSDNIGGPQQSLPASPTPL